MFLPSLTTTKPPEEALDNAARVYTKDDDQVAVIVDVARVTLQRASTLWNGNSSSNTIVNDR